MQIKLDYGTFPPERAHPTDAGLDLRSPEDYLIGPMSSVTIPTGVRVKLPPGTAGLLVSKSGLNVKYDLTSTGLIDEPYRGQIMVKLYNHGMQAYKVERGDKISQLVVIPVAYESVELVPELDETDRGEGGFGSTGR